MKNKSLIIFKKIISYMLALLVVVSGLTFTSTAKAVGGTVLMPMLRIGSQSAENGANISVPLNASDFVDVEGMTFNIQYDDTLLIYTGYTQNALSGHGTLAINPVGNQIMINWFDSSPLTIINSSALLTLNFTVISATVTNTNLIFTGTREINDSTGTPISTTFIDGIISLNPDTTAPVITLLGNAIVNLLVGDVYADAGATASDNADGDITASIVTVNSVNTAVIGTYTVTYNVSDVAGNAASQVSRTVFVSGGMLVISLIGAPEITLTVGDTYTELGATASDQIDGPLAVQITGSVDTTVVGNYTITYTATDADNNTVTVARIIHVVAAPPPPVEEPEPDTTAPVITLLGDAIVNLIIGDAYDDAGSTALDDVDGDITLSIVKGGTYVNTSIAGTYTITYNVHDAAGNPAEEMTRTVTVTVGTVPHQRGSDGALVSLHVYTDYQCPYCAQFQSTLNQALEEYQGEINYFINHYPLSEIHPNAWKAAEATECANDQGDNYFWQMNDWLVSMATNFTIDDIKNFAATLADFDTEQFNSCLDLNSKSPVIQDHIGDGNGNGGPAGGVEGVPTTYVHRNSDGQFEKVEGAVSYEELKEAIDSLLPEPEIFAPDATSPVITLLGNATVNLTVGDAYDDAGATALDNIDGDKTSSIVKGGTYVDTSIAGTYTITYNVSDVAGNAATEVIRTVIISAVIVQQAPAPSGGGSGFVVLFSGSLANTGPTYPIPNAPVAVMNVAPAQAVLEASPVQAVLGVKVYNNGALIRGSDHKIYVVENDKLHHILNLKELAKYIGQDILKVNDEVITAYGQSR